MPREDALLRARPGQVTEPAPSLRQEGYAVNYQEFDDGHVIPPQIACSAADWFLELPGMV